MNTPHAETITYSSDPAEIDQFKYLLEYIDENGASCIVWDGESLAVALSEQAAWEAGE